MEEAASARFNRSKSEQASVRAYVRERWTQLEDEVIREWPGIPKGDIGWIDGEMDRLVTVVQVHYGLTRRETINQVGKFLDRIRV